MASVKCSNCGAALEFAPGTDSLKCQYCGNMNKIEKREVPIQEHDFSDFIHKSEGQPSAERAYVECTACSARVDFAENEQHKQCAFCGADIATETVKERQIQPESLIPFNIKKETAEDNYRKWISKLWFAPTALKSAARVDAINGVYTPYFTFDADARADYKGQRGTYYYETESYKDSEGKSQTREVRKTSWSRVSGTVKRFFNDIVVAATRTLPESIRRALTWDLSALKPYTEEYFKGFSVELYNRSLNECFNEADSEMQDELQQDARRQIGGDEQRIDSIDVQYSDIRFKHLLLPLWISSYRFNNKSYRFLVNGQSGVVKGERPWSVIKIVLFVLFIAALAVGIWFAYTYFAGNSPQ